MFYGYIRVSSKGQVDGQSPEQQEQIIRGAAQIHGAAEAKLFRDDAVSGSVLLSDRPEGSKLMTVLVPGDTVCASKLDRMFRSCVDTLTQIDALKQRGINVILCDISIEPVTNDGVGRLFLSMLAAFAEFERNRILERVNEGRRSKRARGGFIGGRAPFGYRAVGSGKGAVLVPDQPERALLDHVVAIAQDKSLREISAELAAAGYVSRVGKPFGPMQISRMLGRG